MTVNSNNEIEQFKKKLSKDQWNFVESLGEVKPTQEFVLLALVEALKNDKDWFVKEEVTEALEKIKSK